MFSTEKSDLFDNSYNDLNLPVDFTGGILAASEFLQELYVHMGFHPAWKYKNVFELVLSHGDLIETRDVSKRMEEIRNRMVQAPLEPGVNATKERIEEWVASTFKLDYRFWSSFFCFQTSIQSKRQMYYVSPSQPNHTERQRIF